jgi:cobalt transporter subunit CbtA
VAVFRRLVLAALCAGLLCGILAAVAHQLLTVPLIRRAEIYEQSAQPAATVSPAQPSESAIERAAGTLAGDLLAAVGFALLLAAGIALRGRDAGWREGLLWGLAGFAAFTLAPSLGLPPEIPGSVAAPLAERQLWWLVTAVSTGSGLALLLFSKRPAFATLALLLIVLPHLYGAPQPAKHAAASASEALAHRFAALAMAISFLFWAALGASTGYFYRLLAPRPYGAPVGRPASSGGRTWRKFTRRSRS